MEYDDFAPCSCRPVMQVLAQGDSAVLGPPFNAFEAQSAAEPDAELPLQQPHVPMVVVRCSSLELDRRWRHAGGPEDWRVACLCGTQVGELTENSHVKVFWRRTHGM